MRLVLLLATLAVVGCATTKPLPVPVSDRCQELRDNIASTRASIHELRWTQEAEARSSKEYIARLESEIAAYEAELSQCKTK